MIEKRKISRTIPFGYEKVNGKDLLRPIKDQLKHLNTAKNLYKDGSTSLRRASQWLTDNTGRYISHVGLRKRLQNERRRKNQAKSIRQWAEYAEKAIAKAKALEEERTGSRANG